ncbi:MULTISPECIES: hypothetical protein [Streptomyces]|uniref:Uncharacterized protein n=1 Tax=Streptomyces fimbriatus TaxID=68197 RepID=A0ABW0DJU3_STRFI
MGGATAGALTASVLSAFVDADHNTPGVTGCTTLRAVISASRSAATATALFVRRDS